MLWEKGRDLCYLTVNPLAVLDGEAAVPYTCNPLQQGGIPVPGFVFVESAP